VTFGYGVVRPLGLIFWTINLDIKYLGFYTKAHGVLLSLSQSTVEIVGWFLRDRGGSNETFLSSVSNGRCGSSGPILGLP